MGRFADLICPYHSGHSGGVAELAAAAAARCGIDAAGTRTIRRAGLVHDLGRVAVSAATWGKPGPLNADEWEQVRLHPYRTERVLSRAAFLAGLAPVAGTVSSLIAPPFHRSTRAACGPGSSRCSVMFTSSSRVRSSCLRSLSVVVGASHTWPRSSPRARIAARSCGDKTLGRAASRRASSASAPARARRACSHSVSRPRATSRLPGSTAR
ncbi:MAG: HD-GYP domain-containing protein [Micromonosporaceae bacterium]